MSLCKERGKKHLVQDELTFHLWAKLDYLVLLIGGGGPNAARIEHGHCMQVVVGFIILGHFQMEKDLYLCTYIQGHKLVTWKIKIS